MILLWGIPGDGPLDAVCAALERERANFRLLDQRDAARSTANLRIEGKEPRLYIDGPRNGDRLDCEHVRAAYLRPNETARALPRGCADDRMARHRADSVDCAIVEWADSTSALVVNPPSAMAANNSKPYQLRLIAQYGFAVPDTLVTTDPDAVRAFAARHGRLIYKSVSGMRSIVNTLRREGFERLDDVANAPTQFQQYVSGVDVRVHVIGDEVFATEVRSEAHDYRYASLGGHGVELAAAEVDREIADRCRAMAAGMRLAVAGIDLRRTPDHRWICFEVNPSPAFVYYEQATGQPIARAIAQLLARTGDGQGVTAPRPRSRQRKTSGAHSSHAFAFSTGCRQTRYKSHNGQRKAGLSE
jgi:glutathione synthase/RimK-type ligase-like ATP-grasp enzyme